MTPADGDAGGLGIREDIDFQRRSWRVERAGQVAMWAVVALALLGAFKNGPLSDARAGGGESGIGVGYDRFLRNGDPFLLELQPSGTEPVREVSISRAYLANLDVDHVLPEPASQALDGDRAVFRFDGRPKAVRVALVPRTLGIHRASLALGDREPVTFTQFVFP